MMKVKENKWSGFTLIELLVVISLIAIISTVAVVSLNSIRSTERDSRRLIDIKKIVNALEKYRNINGTLPLCASNYFCDYSTPADWTDCLGLALKPILGEIPVDPGVVSGAGYCYKVLYQAADSQISLVYFLENVNSNLSDAGNLNVLKNDDGLSEYEIIIQRLRD